MHFISTTPLKRTPTVHLKACSHDPINRIRFSFWCMWFNYESNNYSICENLRITDPIHCTWVSKYTKSHAPRGELGPINRIVWTGLKRGSAVWKANRWRLWFAEIDFETKCYIFRPDIKMLCACSTIDMHANSCPVFLRKIITLEPNLNFGNKHVLRGRRS